MRTQKEWKQMNGNDILWKHYPKKKKKVAKLISEKGHWARNIPRNNKS